MRLRQLLSCFETFNINDVPTDLLDYLRELISSPKEDFLTLLEINRLDIDAHKIENLNSS